MDVNFHLERMRKSQQSKGRVLSVARAVRALLTVHEDKVKNGDSWRNAYRLPEAFGVNERKKADLLDFLPEVVIKSELLKDRNFAVTSKAVLEHFKNACRYKEVQARAIESAVDYGTGIIWNGVAKIEREISPVDVENPSLFLSKDKKEKVCTYFGLSPEVVDIRDFFPDPSAKVDHDPTGQTGMDWAYRRKIYSLDSFKKIFGSGQYKNIDKVRGVSFESIAGQFERDETKAEGEEKGGQDLQYVAVYEGVDVVLDEQVYIANDVLIYEGANPYAHKEIPVVLYYNYKRDDSVWGISELEINAPYIFIKELLINLVIDNAKFSQQPVLAVNGDLNFDPDEFRLEQGAIWNFTGLNGGSVRDAIVPLTFGSAVEPAMAVKQMIEDHQIQQTGDDSRSLMAQPNELATQTMAKRQALQKRIRKNVMLNSIRSETIMVHQMFSNIHQFLSAPFVDMSGNTVYHEIYVDDYSAVQRNATSKVKLEPMRGHVGVFKLNSKVINPSKIRFQVIEKVDDTIKKEVEMQGLQWWMQTIFTFAQAQPELIKSLDLAMLAKQTGSYFSGLDTEAIFSGNRKFMDGVDEMTYYIQQIQLGIKPTFPLDGKNFQRLEEFNTYLTTKEYERTIGTSPERSTLFLQSVAELASAVRTERQGEYASFNELSTAQGLSGANPQSSPILGSDGGAQVQPSEATQQTPVA